MGYSVELHFDAKSELIIKEYWKFLYENGGGEFMFINGCKPHISLAVYYSEMENLEKLQEIVKKNFEKIEKFKLRFSSIGVFPGEERVTFLNPKASSKLLSLQGRLYYEIKKNEIHKYYWGHYKPKVWVPHCTMIVNETIERNLRGMEILSEIFVPFDAVVNNVALVEFYPFKNIMELELL